MTAPVRAGDLRLRVKLQQRNPIPDGIGGQGTSWTDVAVVSASLQPLAGREKLAAAEMQTSVTHQMVIRYQPRFADPKVMAAMRAVLVKDGVRRIFDIHDSRDDEERRRFIILDLEEGLNDG